jgi:hypothetical protein
MWLIASPNADCTSNRTQHRLLTGCVNGCSATRQSIQNQTDELRDIPEQILVDVPGCGNPGLIIGLLWHTLGGFQFISR